MQNGVDFSNSRNLVITVGATLTVAAGDLTLKLGGMTLGGIGTATFGAIRCHHLLGKGRDEENRTAPLIRRHGGDGRAAECPPCRCG